MSWYGATRRCPSASLNASPDTNTHSSLEQGAGTRPLQKVQRCEEAEVQRDHLAFQPPSCQAGLRWEAGVGEPRAWMSWRRRLRALSQGHQRQGAAGLPVPEVQTEPSLIIYSLTKLPSGSCGALISWLFEHIHKSDCLVLSQRLSQKHLF